MRGLIRWEKLGSGFDGHADASLSTTFLGLGEAHGGFEYGQH